MIETVSVDMANLQFVIGLHGEYTWVYLRIMI